jgi:hypothetical protein
MPRGPRLGIPGALYHVMVRRIDRQKIYLSDADRNDVVCRLGEGVLRSGSGPVRHLTIRFGSRIYPAGFYTAARRQDDGVVISIKNGGTMIDYEDEDPEIRRRFEAELKRAGVPCEMPQVSYAGS